MHKRNPCIGPTFESFLEEEGLLEKVRTKALKTVLVLQLEQAMKEMKISKTDLAKKMGTTRTVLQRLLNPQNTSVTLNTLDRVAQAIGKKLYVTFH